MPRPASEYTPSSTRCCGKRLAVDDSGYLTEQVIAMAYDYTTDDDRFWFLPVGSEMGYLASIDLDTGAVTKPTSWIRRSLLWPSMIREPVRSRQRLLCKGCQPVHH